MSYFPHRLLTLPLLGLMLAASPVTRAQDWDLGAVLDLGSASRGLALGGREQGLQLGHSELSAAGPLGPWLRGQATLVLATHEGRLEKEVEALWLETTRLPFGLTARGGRFAPQLGALNAQHPHEDDFGERPLLYRAFLGGHWVDEGLRLSLDLPTWFDWTLSAEALRGRRLQPEGAGRSPGAFTLSSRLSLEADERQRWQLGLSYLQQRRLGTTEHHEEEEEEAGHAHAARFGGRRTWVLDAAWHWAPGGDAESQQLRLGLELARVAGLVGELAGGRHEAQALSAVWRLHPQWELGARLDRLRLAGHEQTVERLREQTLMLAWLPRHGQRLRLQLSRQPAEFTGRSVRSWQLHWQMELGGHAGHSH